PGGRRRRGGGGCGRRGRLRRGRRDQYQRVVAWFDQPELLACDRLDGGVGACLLDLPLELDVVGAQIQNLCAQRVCFAVQAVVVDRLLPGCDQRIQQQWHDEDGRETERRRRWADRAAQ